MPQRTRHRVSVPRRPRARIRRTTCGKHDGIGVDLRTAREHDSHCTPLCHKDLGNLRLRLNLHAELMEADKKRINGIHRAVADGKDAPSAFHLRLHTKVVEEGAHGFVVKSMQDAVEECAVSWNILHDISNRCNIRDVAPSLSRDHHLPTGLFHLFQKAHRGARFRRLCRRHEPCRACTDDEDTPHTHRSSTRL